jgi:putative Mg2+ transporter-C (MgtC) family protein
MRLSTSIVILLERREFMDIKTVLMRLGLAIVLGGIVGWEREAVDKPAGFRTLTMVCVGSTLFVVLTLDLVATSGTPAAWDPLRTVAAIIQGIGFLGAGTVLRRGETIKGLTTAAALWTVTAIGVAIGFGMYTTALLGTLSMLLILRGLSYVQGHGSQNHSTGEKES